MTTCPLCNLTYAPLVGHTQDRCRLKLAEDTIAKMVRERDGARLVLKTIRETLGAKPHADLGDVAEVLSAVVKAARLFRTADTGVGFNDRVECGRLLDAALTCLTALTESPAPGGEGDK